MKKIVAWILIMILAIPNLQVLADVQTQEARTISIIKIEGDIAEVTKGAEKSFKAKEGMKISQGYALETGKDTYLYLQIDSDKVIKMDKNTKITITKSSSKKLNISVLAGEIFVNVKNPLEKESTLEINAGSTTMGVRGTSFAVSFNNGAMKLTLLEGSLNCLAGEEPVLLSQGESLTVTENSTDGSLNTKKDNVDLTAINSFIMGNILENGDELKLDHFDKEKLADLENLYEKQKNIEKNNDLEIENQMNELIKNLESMLKGDVIYVYTDETKPKSDNTGTGGNNNPENPVNVRIAADNKTKIYGEVDPILTAVVTGMSNGETLNYTLSRQAGEDVGEYIINVILGDNPNYTVTKEDGKLTITPKIEVGIEVKGYEGVYDGESHTITVTGTTGNDKVTYSTDGGTTWGETLPTFVNVTNTEVKVKVTNPNYADREKTAIVKIYKRPITVRAASDIKVYDGTALTNANTSITNGELVKGQTYTATVAGSQTDVGTSTNTASNVVVKNGDLDVTANYDILIRAGILIVTPKIEAGIAITGYEGVYDGASHTITVTGITENDKVTYSTDGGRTWGETLPTFTNVTNTEVKAKVTNPNYADREKTAVVKIDKRPIIVTAASDTKVYDGTALTNANTSITSGELVKDQAYTATVTGSQTDVGTSTNTASNVVVRNDDLDVTANYRVTKEAGTLTITPKSADVKIVAENKIKIQGEADPILTAVATGTVNGETLNYTLSRQVGELVGEYAINITLGENPNYIVSKEDAVFKIISNLDTGIAIKGYEGVYDGESHTITVTGTAGNDKVKYSTDGGRTWGETLPTFTNVTNTEVKVKVTNPDYADREKTVVVKIDKRPITVRAASGIKVYDGTALTNASTSITSGELVKGQTYTATVTGSRTDVGIIANTVSDVVVRNGDSDMTANYRVTEEAGTLTITPKSADVKVVAENKIKIQGEADPILTAVVAGTVNAEELNYTLAREVGENVGEYKINVILGDNPNYTVVKTGAVFTITPKAGDVTVTGYEGVYDGESHAITVTGTAGNDNVLYSTDGGGNWNETPPTFTDVTNTEVTVKVTNPNYADRVKTAVVKIDKRQITVTGASAKKTFDGIALTNPTSTVTGEAAGHKHTATVVGSQTDVGISYNTVSNVTITMNVGIEGLVEDVTANYIIKLVNGTLEVTLN